jgi:ribosomal protein S18 acetylase RimI-like enzyme
MSVQLPNENIFMLCEKVNEAAYREMPKGYGLRFCRPDELDIWKLMPFDDEQSADRFLWFMDDFFETVYAPKGNLFFEKCLFVVDRRDDPVGTCFSWKSYDAVTTMGWYKVKKEYEGRGIGRALLTEVMRSLSPCDYPMLLHTQPSSFRAIKLYSDFGFKVLMDEKVGQRDNHIKKCLPELRAAMKKKDYNKLVFAKAPKQLLDFLSTQELNEF